MDEKFIEYLVGGKRFTNLGSYVFDKLIFGIYILLILAIFVVVFIANGSDRSQHYYYHCNAPGTSLLLNGSIGNSCENPFFMKYPVCERLWVGACDQTMIPNGFMYGEPAPWIVRSWGMILGILLIMAFVINHFVHNRSFKFSKIDMEMK